MSEGQRGHHVIPAKAGIHVGATLVVAHSLREAQPLPPLSEGELKGMPASSQRMLGNVKCKQNIIASTTPTAESNKR